MWNRDHRSHRDVSSAARGDVASTPGKRTLTMDLDPGPAAPVQRKAPPSAPDAAASAFASPASGGEAMPGGVRAKMERAFGADFSGVRIHQGREAQSIGALGYTQGNDIHFAPGQYAPDSQPGQELLGHELAHVVQQSQGRVQAPVQAKGLVVNDDPGLEHEADQLGARAARGEIVGDAGAAVAPSAGGPLQMSRGETIQRIVVALGVTTTVAAAIYMALPASVALLLAGSGVAGIGEYWLGIVNGVISRVTGSGTVTPQEPVDESTPTKQSSEDVGPSSEDDSGKEKGTEKGEEKEKETETDKDDHDDDHTPERGSLLEGDLGDCLYSAVNIANGNLGSNEDAYRRIATQWLLAQRDDHPIFDFGDRDELIDVVSTPGAWTGDAGDLSAVALAYSLEIRIRVVTPGNVYVFPGGGHSVTIYHHNNHYTSFPVRDVHVEDGGEIVATPTKSKKAKLEPEKPSTQGGMRPRLDGPDGSSTKTDPSPSSSKRAPSDELSATLAQTLRTLLRVLGTQTKLTEEDRKIRDILKQALVDDRISVGDHNTVAKYMSSGGSSKRHETGAKTTTSTPTARTYTGVEELEDGTIVDYDALDAVMASVVTGVRVAPGVWRRMRADLSRAIELPNKSHPGHGANFDSPQRPEQQIADWLEPLQGLLREVLISYFLTKGVDLRR